MATLTIYRGSHQIGGCCTEISLGDRRILIDLGANLPGTETPPSIDDDTLLARALDGRPVDGLFFTHYHGDHCGLYKQAAAREPEMPMYIGPLAKQILMVTAAYIDRRAPEQGFPIVKAMRTYQQDEPIRPFPGLTVRPYYADHSALDAYMFYIEAEGKKILFTGDYRDHGIQGQALWTMLQESIVPKGVDLLITEGTMLSRTTNPEDGLAFSEQELGQRAGDLFRQHKHNFVLVSSTNLDSVMSFYHNTPEDLPFVCDFYQARLIITALEGMGRRKGVFPWYRASECRRAIRVLDPGHEKWQSVQARAKALGLELSPIGENELTDGFVMLVRKNTNSEEYTTCFEEARDRFYSQDGQIIYSMWREYLGEEHADPALIEFIGGRPCVPLHTSGHAYVKTIAKLIETVNPKTIVPMHTERADEFTSIPEFTPYKDRVQVLNDGEALSLVHSSHL